MLDTLLRLIVDESKWLTVSLACAVVGAAISLRRPRGIGVEARSRIEAALSLFFAITIGTMAFGHLLAVSVKLALGTLQGSLLVLGGIGFALAVPAAVLAFHTLRSLARGRTDTRLAIWLNAWLAATLVLLGVHNLPLALPGLLGIAYHLHSRPLVGRAILASAVILGVGLFIGSLVFLLSGQSFEQFSGMAGR